MSSTFAADAELAARAVAQRGAFTRAQAVASGFTASQIERRVRAGAWERVLPGVYRHATTPESSSLVHWAAVLWAGPGSALSHASAATIWRLPTDSPDRPELIVPATRAPRSRRVVVHRVVRIDVGDVVRVHHLPVTTPVRTIIDLAGVLTDRDLEIVLDHARTRGVVTIRAVRVRLDELGSVGRPGAARLGLLLRANGSAGGSAPGSTDGSGSNGSGPVVPSARMSG